MLPYADTRASDVRWSEWKNTIIAAMTISTDMGNSQDTNTRTGANTNLRTGMRMPTATATATATGMLTGMLTE